MKKFNQIFYLLSMKPSLRSLIFILPFIFYLLCGHSLWAQYSYNSPVKESDFKEDGINQKLKGKVFLVSGQTVEGDITIYHQHELARVKLPDSSEAAFAPLAVRFIEAVDLHDGYTRLFKVLPYAYRIGNGFREVPTYFEEVVPGPYSLLIRRTLESVYIHHTKVPIQKAEINSRLNSRAPRIEDQIAYKFYLQVRGKDVLS
jgi:hypothetical protein